MKPIIIISLVGMLTSTIAYADTQSRPSLITEELMAHENQSGVFNDRSAMDWYQDNEAYGAVWRKLLTSMHLPFMTLDEKDWRAGNCKYNTAITVLNQIRSELGKDTPYQTIWAANQDRVFSSCDSRSLHDAPPLQLEGKDLPKRAASDFLYQQASWNYYENQCRKALELYQQVAADKAAPMRPLAAYMVARSQFFLGEAGKAYDTVGDILADSSLLPVHAIAGNYRFIMMNSDGQDISYRDALAERHLRWLSSVAHLSPEKSMDVKQAFRDYFDAMEQLNRYFPLFDKESKAVDWWLRYDVPLNSPRMQAVKALAPKDELVDWMQSKWAYNVIETDWLWALHYPDMPYWKQNDVIVAHAWQRWQHGDGLEWLQIAAQRIRPTDALSDEIVNAISPYLARDWQTETPDYQGWLYDIWCHAIRIHLGKENYTQAFELMAHPVGNQKPYQRYSYYQNYRSETDVYNHAMRWLVYTGHFDKARELLPSLLSRYKFPQWEILLAPDWQTALSAVTKHESWGDNSLNDSNGLWQAMVNRLSTQSLEGLATNSAIPDNMRASLSLTALTRAILLHHDNDIQAYATLAAKLNPSARERILSSVEQQKINDYIGLILRIPRMRPVPLLSQYTYDESPKDVTAIDPFYHSDNDWWCRTNDSDLEDTIFNAAKIAPAWTGVFPLDDYQKELAPYLEKQKAFLAQHPYHTLINKTETEALEKIPSAPEFLTQAVIDKANSSRWKFWLSSESKNQIAADLHHAIRTTRYGCQRNGSHAAYSKAAFDILHSRYKDSIWTRATPYWFGCSHFKWGCPVISDDSNKN